MFEGTLSDWYQIVFLYKTSQARLYFHRRWRPKLTIWVCMAWYVHIYPGKHSRSFSLTSVPYTAAKTTTKKINFLFPSFLQYLRALSFLWLFILGLLLNEFCKISHPSSKLKCTFRRCYSSIPSSLVMQITTLWNPTTRECSIVHRLCSSKMESLSLIAIRKSKTVSFKSCMNYICTELH